MKRHPIFLMCLALAGSLLGLLAFRYMCIRVPQRPFDSEAWDKYDFRQGMIRDLVTNVLPGKHRQAIEALLGDSPTQEDMRRYTDADLNVREQDERGNWKPFPRTGDGYYFDEREWDLLYPIGQERIFIYDHRGVEMSPDPEYLIIRFDQNNVFESWFIDGSLRWPAIVGDPGRATYRPRRRAGNDIGNRKGVLSLRLTRLAVSFGKDRLPRGADRHSEGLSPLMKTRRRE